MSLELEEIIIEMKGALLNTFLTNLPVTLISIIYFDLRTYDFPVAGTCCLILGGMSLFKVVVRLNTARLLRQDVTNLLEHADDTFRVKTESLYR